MLQLLIRLLQRQADLDRLMGNGFYHVLKMLTFFSIERRRQCLDKKW